VREGAKVDMSKDNDLQAWPEVPSIAHFCSLFREAFHLFEFDIQEFEESLLLLGADDDTDQLVRQLVVKLLQGCLPMYRKRITSQNYSKYLKQLLQSKKEDAEEDSTTYKFDNPFDEKDDLGYEELALKDKVAVLNQLCEFRLEAADVAERVKNLDAASLRVEPLGVDSEGTTLWYFYGTRLYREDQPIKGEGKELDRKKRKKHKKEKKKKRKKSREDQTESSDEEEQEANWSVACLTELDWENLTAKYKESKRKEDRKLYKLLNDSFMPEIKDMFLEKEKEEQRKMQHLLSKRSSSRIEVLKKTQEERDRQLALLLAEEADGKGKRGRKRKNGDLEDDEEVGEVEREDRQKQREMMKEMRARRAAEKLVESKYGEEVTKQKSRIKQTDPKPAPEKENGKKSRRSPSIETNSDSESPPPSPSDSGSEDEDLYRPPREQKPSAAPRAGTFTNALIRAGVKSTKDATLKEEKKSLKELMVERPLVRKTAGLLLQAAGTGLLNKAAGGKAKESPGEEVPEKETLSFGTNSGISFGLWGGHLSVDQSAGNSSLTSGFDDKPFSLLNKDKKDLPAKKVFSNWGGDFFKKNLDYRANTNKILEKMQLSKSGLGDLNGGGS